MDSTTGCRTPCRVVRTIDDYECSYVRSKYSSSVLRDEMFMSSCTSQPESSSVVSMEAKRLNNTITDKSSQNV